MVSNSPLVAGAAGWQWRTGRAYRITSPSGDSHELDYVMRDTGSGWHVVDVLADGSISRVAVQQSDFRRLLSRGGAPALVASLTAKSQELSDGRS